MTAKKTAVGKRSKKGKTRPRKTPVGPAHVPPNVPPLSKSSNQHKAAKKTAIGKRPKKGKPRPRKTPMGAAHIPPNVPPI
jgi:hypothetical protein